MEKFTVKDYQPRGYVFCKAGHSFYTTNSRRTCLDCGYTQWKDKKSGQWTTIKPITEY